MEKTGTKVVIVIRPGHLDIVVDEIDEMIRERYIPGYVHKYIPNIEFEEITFMYLDPEETLTAYTKVETLRVSIYLKEENHFFYKGLLDKLQARDVRVFSHSRDVYTSEVIR